VNAESWKERKTGLRGKKKISLKLWQSGKRERIKMPRKIWSRGLWKISRFLMEMDGPI
jgi:hypothetical protein